MTPSDLMNYVRQRYNAVGDSFFADGEIYNYFWAGQTELAQETFCIRRTYTTTSVVDQRIYDMPAYTLSLRRVEFDGERIFPNDFLDDDALTGNNPDDDISGTPEHYQIWDSQYYLRPTPSTAATIKLYTYDLPTVPSSVGTLDVPERYHLMLADYALYCMLSKDKNRQMAQDHLALWKEHKQRALQTERLRMVGDSFSCVKDMDDIADDSRFS